jgi:DNA-3-methyladenine glycosylase II
MMHYKEHLQKDEVLKPLLVHAVPELKTEKNLCVRLMASIMSQQLNTKVATVIYKRFLELYSQKEPTPKQVLDTSDALLRSIGLSNAKVNYVKNTASFWLEEQIDDEVLMQKEEDEIIITLTKIKGVGRWTTEMLLMFSMGKPDVFAADDLGIQQAMCKLYNIDSGNKKLMKQKMQEISSEWSPFRTYACLHLWRWKDNKPNL